jgi:hypothetical protein
MPTLRTRPIDASTVRHLKRGILRATALEHALHARAATGRYINIPTRRIRTTEPPPAPAASQAEQPVDQPVKPKVRPRPSHPTGWSRTPAQSVNASRYILK